MSKMTSYWEDKRHDLSRHLYGQYYHSITQEQAKAVDELLEVVKTKPLEDVEGKPITVDCRVAAAVNAGRCATLMVGTVVNIDVEKGIQVQEEARTYKSWDSNPMNSNLNDKPKLRRYGFPDRLVVLT